MATPKPCARGQSWRVTLEEKATWKDVILLALPTEEAKGLGAAAEVLLPMGLQQCGSGGTGQLGQHPAPPLPGQGPGCRKQMQVGKAHPKSDPSWAAGSCLLTPERVNSQRGRAGPPTVMRSPLPEPILAPILLQPRSVWQQRSREPKLRVRAAADKHPGPSAP